MLPLPLPIQTSVVTCSPELLPLLQLRTVFYSVSHTLTPTLPTPTAKFGGISRTVWHSLEPRKLVFTAPSLGQNAELLVIVSRSQQCLSCRAACVRGGRTASFLALTWLSPKQKTGPTFPSAFSERSHQWGRRPFRAWLEHFVTLVFHSLLAPCCLSQSLTWDSDDLCVVSVLYSFGWAMWCEHGNAAEAIDFEIKVLRISLFCEE